MLKLKEKDKEILKEIKRVIMDVAKEMEVEIDKIILFGSRARGDYREDSDWDILVVTKRKLDREKMISFLSKVYLRLAKYGTDADILVKAKEEFVRKSRFYGSIFYFIKNEGVRI